MRLAAFARAEGAPAGLAAAVAGAFAAERDRWALWLPALMGAGIALYFALPIEPPLWLGPVAALACAIVAWAARGRPALPLALIALGALAVGFAAAEIRAAQVAAPVLARPIGPVAVTGRVIAVAPQPRGARFTLDRVRIERLAARDTPARVRVRVLAGAEKMAAGDVVAMRAKLSPPPGPAAPGAFDFARRAWFQGLGAVGFAYGRPHLVARGEATAFSVRLARLRAAATARVRAALAGDTGAMAAALMTGERGAISEATLAAMRNSGLAHLLAISGLHMGLVAGIVFFFVRLALAAVPSLALRRPDQEVGGGGRARRRGVLPRHLGRDRADPARLRHGRDRARRRADRPRRDLDAAGRLGGGDRAGDGAGKPDRAQLPDVVRRGHRADRDLRGGELSASPRGAPAAGESGGRPSISPASSCRRRWRRRRPRRSPPTISTGWRSTGSPRTSPPCR